MNCQTAICNCGAGEALLLAMAGALGAVEYQLESWQFIAELTDADQNSVPPGLDEPLNCDRKRFYDELGLDILDDQKPILHDMSSIRWRLIHVETIQFDRERISTIYLPRKSDGSKNECETTYGPTRPRNGGEQNSSYHYPQGSRVALRSSKRLIYALNREP